MVYETKTLKLVNNLVLDVSPAILIPFYDEDSNTLFLTGKVIENGKQCRYLSNYVLYYVIDRARAP